ncbi:protein kinase [Gluconacetobacter sp. 1b LMG 1731]|uniref:Protein kinase n=1 Tax=Gluconacetobacter dulcium TaxID=2729096 RepID=A0A7W4INS5_9PROT|nr:serine/threonine-protein kinase [Gluconacetobacter dulcium]MBB2166159.1 protein kinase [Gluconacetobacter dulcium]MBB2195294.1 protein kinase [Gluconacetobacter dulcium]
MSGVLHATGDLVGDRYEVANYIGQGGMQEVYRVHDQLLERDVVLKSPKNPTAKKRFSRSATLSARVNHDNVAKTLDYVEEDDRFYLVEELIEGCDLGHFLKNYVAMLDPFAAGRVMHHLAKGLAASHHVNVIHRDLKPTNVMVVGGRDFIGFKITDFGIAKMAQEEIQEAVAGDEEGLTSSQTALGALPYMAPETIDDMKHAGKPADVWAIAALTFEILTGKRPFGAGYKAVPLIQAAQVPPLPAPLISKSQFTPFVTAIFDLIKLCMQKDPAARPTADQLVAACEGLYYSTVPREFGTIKRFDNNNWGFATTVGSDIFCHVDSVYAEPALAIGERVWMSPYPGSPSRRAFPIVKAK